MGECYGLKIFQSSTAQTIGTTPEVFPDTVPTSLMGPSSRNSATPCFSGTLPDYRNPSGYAEFFRICKGCEFLLFLYWFFTDARGKGQASSLRRGGGFGMSSLQYHPGPTKGEGGRLINLGLHQGEWVK